jgi:hypothetical protein
MQKLTLLTAVLIAASCLAAQEIPPGTLLPAMLHNTLDSNKSKPGEEISATLKQDVPLPGGGKIKRGSKILGRVVAVTPQAGGGSPARFAAQFNSIEIDKKDVTISTSLRALASMEAVAAAKQPVNATSGYGTSVWDWNMVQVGGQAVFNGQRIVKGQNGEVVGNVPQPGAVLGVPLKNPDRGCTEAAHNTSEQAFWVFSTDACGTYGYKGLTLVQEAGGALGGQIVLTAEKGIVIRSGSGLLLQVKPADSTAPSH